MVANFFRVSNAFSLPRHWAYGEAWELQEQVTQTGEDTFGVTRSVVDRRVAGCQGWCDLSAAIAATVWHQDGDYGPRDYAFLLLIETPDAKSTTCWWDCCTTATGVWSVDLADLHVWLRTIPECCENDELDAGAVQKWVESHEEETRKYLAGVAIKRHVRYTETLPCPKSYRKWVSKT